MKRRPCWVSCGSWILFLCSHFLFLLWIFLGCWLRECKRSSLLFVFIWQRNTSSGRHATLSVCSLQLAVQFLFNTYFRTTKKLRSEKNHAVMSISLWLMFKQAQSVWFCRWWFLIFRIHTEEWCRCIGTIVKHNSEACSWFLNFLAGERGKGHVRYVWVRNTSYWSRNTFHWSRNACQETSKALFVSSF